MIESHRFPPLLWQYSRKVWMFSSTGSVCITL